MAAEVLKLNAKFTLLEGELFGAYKDKERREAVLNALRKAGLPDKAPTAQP